MAVLRAVEERDNKGNVIRYNPTITWLASQHIRTVIGKHDYRLEPNPDYHQPITAQAQEGKIRFFVGTPDSANTRAAAKEIAQTDVPPYIIAELKARPMRFKEPRPTVYEIKLATVGDVNVTEAVEMSPDDDGQGVTVHPEMSANLAAAAAAHAGRDLPEGTQL